MALGSKTTRVVQDGMAQRKPFRRGNVTGSLDGHGSGWLDEVWRATWWQDREAGIGFVVYSYQTPIAWLVTPKGGPPWWRIPPTRHSLSTTGHQWVVRRGAEFAGEPWVERPNPLVPTY